MPLFLTESDVKSILTMPLTLEAVENSFLRLATGEAILHPRARLHLPGKSFLHYMAAADSTSGYMGLKIYTSAKAGLRFLILLFSVESGELLAQIEADYVGQMRTGAASGFATRLLARADAKTIGIIGTGLQARTQLEAITQVRQIESIKVFGRDQQRREKFAADMSAKLSVPVTAVATAEEAVRDQDIVVTSTTATNPVVEGRWLTAGSHLNAIGANFPQKRELDAETIRRCDVIVADSREQSKIESGDLIQMYADDHRRWTAVIDLADIASGKIPGRTKDDQITLFKSNGIATEDIVVAGKIYELAKERGAGKNINMWEGSTGKNSARAADARAL
ncbi:MAG TPA: ornithine cyclodeaminase family protein [Candidatus Acidoferrales bacterium]